MSCVLTRSSFAAMDLIIETEAADQLSPQRKAILDAMFQREFGNDPLTYARPQWYVVGILQTRLIACVGVLKRVIEVDGEPLRVGGITGVVTEPEYRGRGIASTLVARAVHFMREELKLPLALLTCKPRLGPFYEKLGWQTVEEPTIFAQADGPRTVRGLTMVVESGSARWPEGLIDLQGLPW